MPPSGGAEHETVGPSRDRKEAVEATSRRVYPSLTVGARFSAIFRGGSHAILERRH